jgi:hypothetical protein
MADMKTSVEDRLRRSLRPPKVLNDIVAEVEKRLGRQRSGTLLLVQIMRVSVTSTQASLKQIESILSVAETMLAKGSK